MRHAWGTPARGAEPAVISHYNVRPVIDESLLQDYNTLDPHFGADLQVE